MAILCGMVLLFPSESRLNQWFGDVDRWAVVAQFLALASSLYVGVFIERRRYFQHWMTFRAGAERIRMEYFEALIVTGEESRANELSILRLAFEYFWQFQALTQLEYFRRKSVEHRLRAGLTHKAMNWIKLGALRINFARWLGNV